MSPDGEDEELPQPGKDPKRLRVELAVGAVLLLIVLYAVKVTTGKSGKVGGPRPSPTSSASHSYGTGAPDSGSGLLDGQSTYGPVTTVTLNAGDGSVISRSDGLPDRTSDDPAACPWPTGSDGKGHAVPGCFEDDSNPLRPTLAVLAVYPNAKLASATSVYLGGAKGPLWFRQLNVYVGTAELLVRVEAPPPNGLPADVSGEQDGITSYSGSLGPHHVYLQINRTGQSAALAKLAKDVRLTQ